MKSLLLIGAIVFSFSLELGPVLAQPMYTVTPLLLDESLEKRDIVMREITLTNTGSVPVTLYPSVNNISIQEGGTIQEFLSPVQSDRTTSLASWIEVSRAGIDLQPGATHTLTVTIRINGEAAPGEYHAFLGFGYGRNRDEAEAQVRSGRAPGTMVNVRIEDTTFSFLKIAAFVVDRFVTSADNQAAVYRFVNPGDEPLVPTGEIILYDTNGREVGALPVNEEKISVAPGEEYVFTAQVPTEGLFGKYKAMLSVAYGGAQRGSVQDTTFFYVLPLQTLMLIGGVLLLLAAGGAWYTHHRYLSDEEDDSERLMLHIKETPSNPLHHDLHITKS